MQELRVVQTGVQILSAFLLSLPFTNRFAQANGFQKAVYLITLVSAAVTTAMVIAPVSYHRHHRDEQARPSVVAFAALLARLSMVPLLVSAVCGVMLAVDVAIGRAVATVTAGVLTAVYAALWYVLPTRHMRRTGRG